MSEAKCVGRWMEWTKQAPYLQMTKGRCGQEELPTAAFFGDSDCHAWHCGPVRSQQTGQSLFGIPTLSFRKAVFGMQRLRPELLWLTLNSCYYWQPRHISYLSLNFSISENSPSSSSHRSLPCFSKALKKYFPSRSVCIRQKSCL